LVERSEAQRARHGEHLSLSRPEVTGAWRGPEFVSLPDLPMGSVADVILANELLDNLPFDLVERREDGWESVRVGLSSDGESLAEVLTPATPGDAALASELVPDPGVGDRLALQHGAVEWLRTALDRVERGRVVVFDYMTTSREMAARGTDWLRTYRGHERGGDPLDLPGDNDVTAEVAVDQLARVAPPSTDRLQSEFLAAHGIDELVDEGRRVWEERAHLGDLAAIKARSRVAEAEALTDPGGLGGFRVLEWQRP
jgi:SAM-dependent MidA family methyltransferase